MSATSIIGDLGEKRLIQTVIMPLLNPEGDGDLPGDDCGIAWPRHGLPICVSTDRVPWDLIAFRTGLIDIIRLGYYLAVLNLSDIAAMGAEALGIVLNLGLPSSFPIDDLRALLQGADEACRHYGCHVLGGDLSDAAEPNLVAAVIGHGDGGRLLRRAGARAGDLLYCSGHVGLTPTAFRYFLDARPAGLKLLPEDEQLLVRQFSRPEARLALGRALRRLDPPVTCMDNTDGFGQTVFELSQLNGVGFLLNASALPIHPISRQVAAFLGVDVIDLALGPGADFQLVGTIAADALPEGADTSPGIRCVGRATSAAETIAVLDATGRERAVTVTGWDYFSNDPVGSVRASS